MSPRKRRSQQSGRAPLSSPGRPPAAKRSELQRFWWGIARGMPSEDAALAAGLSQPVGTRLFREAGGMPPATFRPSAKLPSGRYLSFSEREEIALFRVQGLSGQEIGRRLGRPACTISHELRRNAATRSGGLEYRASTAQWHAERSRRRPKAAKLALNSPYASMSRRGWLERSRLLTALSLSALRCFGGDAVTANERLVDGARPGVLSRSPGVWRQTSRMTRTCGSATKPFIKRSSSKAEAHCGEN